VSSQARARALAAGVLLLLLVVLYAALLRVPDGHVGLVAGRALAAGWHLKSPLARAQIVPASGRLEGIQAQVTTAEGATLVARLSFDYRIDPGRFAPDDEESGPGLAPIAARLVAEALAPGAAGAERPPLAAAAGGVSLSQEMLERVGRHLAEHGLVVSSARGAIGPPATTSGTPAAGARGAMPQRDPTGIRVLLIGLDGADWDTIDPLMRAGRMPRLQRLVAQGVRSRLRSYDPMISPLLWTTIVTGVGPDVHGVADFQAIEQPSGRRIPITSRFRKVKALWNILDDAGMTSAFVAWWASYPAESVRGFQISNLLAFESLRPRPQGRPWPPGIVWPPDYLVQKGNLLETAADLPEADLRPILHLDAAALARARSEVLKEPGHAVPAARRAVQDPSALALSILAGSANYARVAADLAARHADLTGVYFEGIDMMGHRFQHCMPPRMAICPEADFARYQDAVTGFYAYQDRLLGQVVDAAGPGTTVLVLSDHGFRSGAGRPEGVLPYTTEQPVEWHDKEGIFVLCGAGARRGARLTETPSLFDIAPTILELLGLPASDEMPGRVVGAALDPSFLSAHAQRRIPSYETVGAPREREPAAADPAAREAEAELLASLRSLGYIGGDEGTPDVTGSGAAESGATGAPGAAADTQVFYHRNLATYFLKRRDYRRAIEELQQANARQRLPKTDEMLAEAWLGLGRPDEAGTAIRAALAAHPDLDPEPVLWLVRLGAGGAGGAAAARAAARDYAPRTVKKPGLDDAIAGQLLETDGRREEALASYRRSFAADPSRAFVAERLYALESPADRRARLLPALRQAVGRDPRADAAWNLIGTIEAESGRLPAALEAFREANDLAPDEARYAANLGAANARLERWGEAAEAYARALRLEPEVASALRLGSVYRRLGRNEEALAAFARARELGDRTPATFLGMALAQDALGRRAEALASVDAGLALHPGEASLTRLRSEIAARAPAPPPGGAADRPGRSATGRPDRRAAPRPRGRAPRRRRRGRARGGAATARPESPPGARAVLPPPGRPRPAPAPGRRGAPAHPGRG